VPGDQGTIDLRKCQLARLDKAHAKRAWKAYKKTLAQRKANPAG
jgi:hypothetical protein